MEFLEEFLCHQDGWARAVAGPSPQRYLKDTKMWHLGAGFRVGLGLLGWTQRSLLILWPEIQQCKQRSADQKGPFCWQVREPCRAFSWCFQLRGKIFSTLPVRRAFPSQKKPRAQVSVKAASWAASSLSNTFSSPWTSPWRFLGDHLQILPFGWGALFQTFNPPALVCLYSFCAYLSSVESCPIPWISLGYDTFSHFSVKTHLHPYSQCLTASWQPCVPTPCCWGRKFICKLIELDRGLKLLTYFWMMRNHKYYFYPLQLEKGNHFPNVKNYPIFAVKLYIQDSHWKLDQDFWGLQTMGRIFFCYFGLFVPWS